MATPAVPPAKMTAPRLRSDGDAPAGVSAFFVTSYAAKYLDQCQSGGAVCGRGTYAALPGPSRAMVASVPR